MNRRSAIKNISIGMGLSVSVGSILTMVSACQSEPTVAIDPWVGKFLTDQHQANFIGNITDLILPATESPGARDIGVLPYIDMTVNEVYGAKQQERFRKGLDLCMAKVEAEQGSPVIKLKTKQLNSFLNKYIGSDSDPKTYDAAMKLVGTNELPSGKIQQDTYYFYSFLNAVKSMTIAGFFGSEVIATEHMVYDPVPGPFQGCIDYSGNDYSL